MGVAPWELAKQSRAWQSWALAAKAAESEAKNMAAQVAKFRNG